MNTAETKSVLSDFGQNWLNFSTIYKRNQSVKPLLTAKAIQDNAINVDPHANFSSTGQITHVYQEVGKRSSYLLTGTQHSQKQVFEPVLKVEVVRQGQTVKINKITTSYVRTEH